MRIFEKCCVTTQIYKTVFSLVFEKDVEYIGLVLETLRVFQQLDQSVVIDGPVGVSGDAALCCDQDLWTLEVQS